MNAADEVLELPDLEDHGFQFTPYGVISLSRAAPIMRADDMGHGARAAAEPSIAARPRAPEQFGSNAAIAQRDLKPANIVQRDVKPDNVPITAKALLAAARARLRELDKLCPRLEAERAELRRLCSAARGPKAPKTPRARKTTPAAPAEPWPTAGERYAD